MVLLDHHNNYYNYIYNYIYSNQTQSVIFIIIAALVIWSKEREI